MRASLRDVEVSRLEGRRELQDAHRQLKQMDAERAQFTADIADLQSRLARDEERENECRKEIFVLKQKVRLERVCFARCKATVRFSDSAASNNYFPIEIFHSFKVRRNN